MNSMLQSQAALIRTLAESGASLPISGSGESLDKDYYEDDVVPTEAVKRTELLPDTLDVLLAERKVDEALALLDEGEGLVADFHNGNGAEGLSEGLVKQLEEALAERKAGVAAYLAEAVQQPTVRGLELTSAISALDRLGDGSRAHTLLLHSHEERLKHNMNALRQSGASYGGVYTTAVSQLVFSAIAQVRILYRCYFSAETEPFFSFSFSCYSYMAIVHWVVFAMHAFSILIILLRGCPSSCISRPSRCKSRRQEIQWQYLVRYPRMLQS